MYFKIGLAVIDRKYHSFLWKDMDQNCLPDNYEFNKLVFGVNYCPFLAQFVSQNHAENKTIKVP